MFVLKSTYKKLEKKHYETVEKLLTEVEKRTKLELENKELLEDFINRPKPYFNENEAKSLSIYEMGEYVAIAKSLHDLFSNVQDKDFIDFVNILTKTVFKKFQELTAEVSNEIKKEMGGEKYCDPIEYSEKDVSDNYNINTSDKFVTVVRPLKKGELVVNVLDNLEEVDKNTADLSKFMSMEKAKSINERYAELEKQLPQTLKQVANKRFPEIENLHPYEATKSKDN